MLKKIPVSCPVLETIKIDSSINLYLPPPIPQFIGSQQNNLHTLSVHKCILSSDVTRSLIHSLQSPHCKLYKLALYDCTIPTTEHTQLTAAIVSSTTITHLLFIDRNIDDRSSIRRSLHTPSSLTALASGLKHNTTIEQLAVDTFLEDRDQFQALIGAVDSSAVKKLWLCNHSAYMWWYDYCTLTRRKVIDVVWYSSHHDMYNKW